MGRIRCISSLFLAITVCSGSSIIHSQTSTYPTERTYVEPEAEPPEHPVDMLHMRLEVSFVPEQGLVKGKVTHRFRPLRHNVDSIFFNGPGIRILQATLDGKPVRFAVSAAGITVYPTPPLVWDRTDSVTFIYEANPRRGIYFVGWKDPRGLCRRQIWTQGQGIDNRNWIPCYDEQNDKLVTETIVTFDSSYRVLSNGVNVGEQVNGDGTKTWHYAMTHPHSSYLVMLGIGKYDVKTVYTKGGVPVHLWYYPEYPDRVEPTYKYSAECIDFVADQTGTPYPWESYSQIPVQDFLYGAMENTTATVFGDFFLVDRRSFFDRDFIAVNVHELTHQWFGDYVTGRSGRSAWLHESFATFYPKLFLKSVYGEDYYEWTRRNEQNAALAASEQNRLPILHSQSGSARVYQKGSAVLDMMMYAFGGDEFRRVIRHYLRNHAYGNVETNDLYQAFQDVLGLSPSWFFDEWIYRGGEPSYEVSYRDIMHPDGTKRETEIIVSQIQVVDDFVGLFKMPIGFEVHYTDGTWDRKATVIEKETEQVTFPNPSAKSVAFVLFDPGSYILKKVTFPKSFAELQAQAIGAPLMIDRYDAVTAMRTLDLPVKRELLLRQFTRERSPYIKAEIVAQVAGDRDSRSLKVIGSALTDRSVEVRTSALANVTLIPPILWTGFEQLLKDSSYNIVATALTKLASEFPERIPAYLETTRDDRGIGNQVRVLWHELNATRGDSTSLDSLVELAGVSYEFRTRVNALEALKRLNYVDRTLMPGIFDAIVHPNSRLRGPATIIVQFFCQQTSNRHIFHDYFLSRTWTTWERELIEKAIN